MRLPEDFMDIKEDRIKLDTAKLAKQKGFQAGSKHVYIHWNDDSRTECYDDYYTINNVKGADLSNSTWTVYEAPTQTMLKKWLKLKFNLPIVIKWNKSFGWYFRILKHITFEYQTEQKYFDTEEEALENALVATLDIVDDELNETKPDEH